MDRNINVKNTIKKYKLVIFSKTYCQYSKLAKKILSLYNVKSMKIVELDKLSGYKMVSVQNDLKKISKQSTVPQVFLNGKYFGNCENIVNFEINGHLKNVLT